MIMGQCGSEPGETAGCGGSSAVAEVRVSLSSIYVSHCPSPHHPLPPSLLSLSLSLCATRTPLPVLTSVSPPDTSFQSKYQPTPRPSFLPLFMCLLKIVRPAADAILLHSAGPLSPVGRAMTHSLSRSLSTFPSYLPTFLQISPSLPLALPSSLSLSPMCS